MAITHMHHMRARLMDIMARLGFRVESLSARARGITDGAGRSIRATDTIADRSDADTMATDLLGVDMKVADTEATDLLDAVQPPASMAHHAGVRSTVVADTTVVADPAGDAGNRKLRI